MASKLVYIKGQILEFAKSRAMRNFEWAKNFRFWQFFKSNFDFTNWKKFYKLVNFKIGKIGNLLFFYFGKFEKFHILFNFENHQNLTIFKTMKISKISN